ncbi:MAG: ATP-binding protein [Bacteroidetes bacterium]|nr:ATP-binding protein [Bacteroidota bacterium]
MKWSDPLRLSAYIATIIILVSTVTLKMMGYKYPNTFYAALIISVCTLVSIFLFSHYTVFKKIQTVSDEIEKSLSKKKKNKMGDFDEKSSLDVLNNAVNRLIKEKATEIDTLKESEKYRREFLGNVAHELRSPIFNIQGYVHTLLEGAMEDETVRNKFLKKAANNIDLLSDLVNDLVTISLIESGEMMLEHTRFSLNELIKEVMDLEETQAKEKDISLLLKTENTEVAYVFADKQKIKQVLLNLINNSVKYGKEEGATTITISDMNTEWGIEVSDNGDGIAAEHLPRIFERFYRVDKNRERSEGGSGLGLAIVKHFIEAHKHKIYATSSVGIGSIFSFSLDKAKENE